MIEGNNATILWEFRKIREWDIGNKIKLPENLGFISLKVSSPHGCGDDYDDKEEEEEE